MPKCKDCSNSECIWPGAETREGLCDIFVKRPEATAPAPVSPSKSSDWLNCGDCHWQPGTGGIDGCVQQIVEALNAAGLETVASCCGHGKRPGNIALRDGREIIICPDYESGRKIDKLFPPIS